jgi:hypothetical protein
MPGPTPQFVGRHSSGNGGRNEIIEIRRAPDAAPDLKSRLDEGH